MPKYLEPLALKYMTTLGCAELTVLGTVDCAPNVTLIFDPTEVSDQEYDTLLRDEKGTSLHDCSQTFSTVTDALVFPGSYDLLAVCSMLPSQCKIHIDAAYDMPDPQQLSSIKQPIQTVFFSTSSPLFKKLESGDLSEVIELFAPCSPNQIVFKENRGGAQLFDSTGRTVEALPAQLGVTINSVGVGDVFAASYLSQLDRGVVEAGWRATRAAAAYSQTTVPDLFLTYVQRSLKHSLEDLQNLGGTYLPWVKRKEYSIYFAAPDFADADRTMMDRAIDALCYHNFHLRRPIQENGELPKNSDISVLRGTYAKDCQLLSECSAVFAVPVGRDPGTLVEVGLAIAQGKPVVTYDPYRECNNTMVIAGSTCYSDNLDQCLNAIFHVISRQPKC